MSEDGAKGGADRDRRASEDSRFQQPHLRAQQVGERVSIGGLSAFPRCLCRSRPDSTSPGLACFRLLTKITPALPHTPRPRTKRQGLEEERARVGTNSHRLPRAAGQAGVADQRAEKRMAEVRQG